jgi:hypothetical protein
MNGRMVPIEHPLEAPPIDKRPLDQLRIPHPTDPATPPITLLIARSQQESSGGCSVDPAGH